jgi:hypothetical protein
VKSIRFIFLFFFLGFSGIFAQKVAFPLKVSDNGRYLTDSYGIPFFYQAETPWLLFVNLNREEMGRLMDIRIKQGFTVLQTMALTTERNVNGDQPFENKDFSKPNIAYFEHIKEGVQLAGEKGLLVGIAIAWKGCCGGDWNDIILKNGPEKCRQYGRFLGRFFKDCKNIFFIQGGDNDPEAHTTHYREMALGIREFMPTVLQTYHASSGHSSTDMINYLDHSWLNFSWTYTYFPKKHNVWIYIAGWGELPEVYAMNYREYSKTPVFPFILGESQYEGEDSSSYKPLRGCEVARRQAYWSLLSGACGHAYGSWNWPVGKNWSNIENDTGAWDMLHVKRLFCSFEWFRLIPDFEGKIIQKGAGTYGKDDYATAAYMADGSFMLIYIPPTGVKSRVLSIDVSRMKRTIHLQWYNPTNGLFSNANQLIENGLLHITSPGDNGEGANDWVLVMKAQ